MAHYLKLDSAEDAERIRRWKEDPDTPVVLAMPVPSECKVDEGMVFAVDRGVLVEVDEDIAGAMAQPHELHCLHPDEACSCSRDEPTSRASGDAQGCQCTSEQGDSDCPVHPTCHACGEHLTDEDGTPRIAGLADAPTRRKGGGES